MDLSNEPQTINLVAQGSVSAVFLTFINDAVMDMIPFLIVAAVLIMIDLYFGWKAAKKRGKDVRISRAVRRTVGKIFEYVCWITLSATLSLSFCLDILKHGILCIVIGNELISIFSNWAYVNNKRLSKEVNVFAILADKLGIKELKDVKLEDIEEENKTLK